MRWWFYPYAWTAVMALEIALLFRIPITQDRLDRMEAHLAAMAIRALQGG